MDDIEQTEPTEQEQPSEKRRSRFAHVAPRHNSKPHWTCMTTFYRPSRDSSSNTMS